MIPDPRTAPDATKKHPSKHPRLWRISAMDDTMYVAATTEALAIARLEQMTGPIPRSLLTVTELAALPSDVAADEVLV